MPHIIHRPGWFLSERSTTPEAFFHNRRHFLKRLGFARSGLLASALAGCNRSETPVHSATADAPKSIALPKGYPASRNAEFNHVWRLTHEKDASTHNKSHELSLA